MRAPRSYFARSRRTRWSWSDLDERPRVMAHAEPGVAIGDRVPATISSTATGTLVRFRPGHSKESRMIPLATVYSPLAADAGRAAPPSPRAIPHNR
jgi:hypothetical protein